MRLTRQQRTTAIVAIAVQLANEKQLVAVNFADVSQRAPFRMTERAIRYHFGKKGRLLKAVAEHPDASAAVRDEARLIGVI